MQHTTFPTGIFITFEGIDGAGKSSHIAVLADYFRSQGYKVVLTREPGGTTLGENLRYMILHEPMQIMTEALLAFAARAEHLHQVIVPALKRGEIVLCDRFTDSTFAYQGIARGVPIEQLQALEQVVQRLDSLGEKGNAVLQPHRTFWFDVPPAVAAKRLSGARAPDKFESEQQVFFEKVVQGYEWRAAQSGDRFRRIDGDRSIEAIAADVLELGREIVASFNTEDISCAAPSGGHEALIGCAP